MPSGDAGFFGDIAKGSVAIVAEQELALVWRDRGRAEVRFDHVLHFEIAARVSGHKEIQLAVIVIIEEFRGIRVHLCANASFDADIFKSAITEVAEQKRTGIVAGGEQVLTAVAVIIAPSEGDPASLLGESGLLADFAKCSVAFVVIQADAVSAIRVNNSCGDGKIHAAVVVVIRPGRAEGIYGRGETRALGYVSEALAAFVVKQKEAAAATPTIAGEKNILEAVIVVVNKLRGVTAESHGIEQAQLAGNFFKGAVAAVAKQAEWGAFRADQNVFAAVIVEIAPSGATAESEPTGAG